MKILCLSDAPAFVKGTPGCPRLRSFLERLEAEAHGIFFCEKHEVSELFRQHLFLPAPEAGLQNKLRHLLEFRSSHDYRIKHPCYVLQCQETVRNWIEKTDPDLILVKGSATIQFLPANHGKTVVVDFVDAVSSLARKRARQYKGMREKLANYHEMLGLRRLERECCRVANKTFAISPVDAQELGADEVIPNGVDDFWFEPVKYSEADHPILVFTGVMKYLPNAEAAIYFAREILPGLPDEVEFRVVGSDPLPQVLALDNCTVTGRVPDVRPELAAATLFVSPLLTGAGMKNKILNAMAQGTPVIATKLSMDGIAAERSKHYIEANTKDEWLAAINWALANPEKCQTMAMEAREMVRANYSWEQSVELLINLVSSISPADQAAQPGLG